MTTNEYYYNGEEIIDSVKAHALKDKSLLIVADKSLSLTLRKAMVKQMKPEVENAK